MAKRFRDTRSFKDSFVRKLPLEYKMLWFYILDDCDHAGLWKVDIEAANFFCGTNCEIQSALEMFKDKVQAVDEETWYLNSFIKFQYGKLNDSNKVHRSAKLLLEAKGLSPLLGAKEKNKDKDTDKDLDKDKENILTADAMPDVEIPVSRKTTVQIETQKQSLELRNYWHSEFESLFKRKAAFIPAKWLAEVEGSLINQLGLLECKRRVDNNLRDGYKTSPTYFDYLKSNETFAELRVKRVQGPKGEYESKRGTFAPIPRAFAPKTMTEEERKAHLKSLGM